MIIWPQVLACLTNGKREAWTSWVMGRGPCQSQDGTRVPQFACGLVKSESWGRRTFQRWSLFWMPLCSVQWCRVALYSFVVKLQRALCVFPFFPRHIASSVFMCSGFLWCLIAHHKNILLVVHPCSFFPYVFNCSFLHVFHSYTCVIKIRC